MTSPNKARAVGFNHVAIEVGNVDEALSFYGDLFQFEMRGRSETTAFIDLGDQFLALQEGNPKDQTSGRHFGLVVDDKAAVRNRLTEKGIELEPSRFLDFRDPWGNMVEIIQYSDIQFSKTDAVLKGMGMDDLEKTDKARAELAEKGMAPE